MKKMVLILLLSLGVISIGCSVQSEPSIEQIKTDLIGHRIYVSGITGRDTEFAGWEFEALAEFEQFDVRNKQVQDDAIEYDVSMRLHDLSTNTRHLADVLINYEKIDGEWEIVSIVPTLFKDL